MKEGPMQYYIPKMLPEYVEVEPDVYQPYSDATVAGWRNEQTLGNAARQAPTCRCHTDGSVCRQIPDCRERAPVPVFGKAGRPGEVQVPVRPLKPRRVSLQHQAPCISRGTHILRKDWKRSPRPRNVRTGSTRELGQSLWTAAQVV